MAEPKKKPTTVAPAATVVEYPGAPVERFYRTQSGSIWRMDILRGCHSAITIHGAPGIQIRSNNPGNAVSDESDLWVDHGAATNMRTIFFHGNRFPRGAGANQSAAHCSLFEHVGGQASRALLQVWVVDYGSHFLHIRLNGRSMSLNTPDLPPYNLTVNRVVPTTSTAQEIINQVRAEEDKEGGLDHLVFNCHGTRGYQHHPTTIWIGRGFNDTKESIALWSQLRSVRYIWFMNCLVGSDNQFMGKISENSRAWVSAPVSSTSPRPAGIPKDHIEYFERPTIKHWNGTSTPQEAADFFGGARRSANPDLTTGLSFNLVEKGSRLPRSEF